MPSQPTKILPFVEVFLRVLGDVQAAIFTLAPEAVDAEWGPSCAAFEEGYPQVGVGIKNAIDHHAGEGDGQREGHAEGAGRGEDGEGVEA